jgi:hypothetical protein
MLLMILIDVAISLVAVVVYGALHYWRAGTNAMRARLEAERSIIGATRYEPRAVDGLPVPAQRYFRAVLIATVYAGSRDRIINGQLVATPWQGRFWSYDTRHGMRVPSHAEVAWLLPQGSAPSWRGRITDIAYEFAR